MADCLMIRRAPANQAIRHGAITLTWRWRFRWWRFVRERKWRNARDWFRERIWRRLGYLGLDHNLSYHSSSFTFGRKI